MPGEYRIKLLKGAQKDRDNIRQYRLVYEVDTANRIVRIISMWTHYE